MTVTVFLFALLITTIAILRWMTTGRVGHNGGLGSVSQHWLAEYRQDHGW